MDILTFLSNVIDGLAWPGSLLVALWLFRRPLSSLIDAVRNAKFRYAKGETSIEGELETIREKVPTLPQTQPPHEVRGLSQSSPLQAIDKSWEHLEASAIAAASISMPVLPLKVAGTLIDKNILTPTEAEAFYRMYEIRKEVTKPGTRFITDTSSASAYSSLAYGLSERIRGTDHFKAETESEDAP